MSNQKKGQVDFIYPRYIPQELRPLLGLTVAEMLIVVIPVLVSMLLRNFIIIGIAFVFSGVVFFLINRMDDPRKNNFMEFSSLLRSMTMNKIITRRGRDKSPKKSIKKISQYSQDYMPFDSISDNYLTMENGNKYVYLRILASGLNIASKQEILKLIDDHKDFFNTMKQPFSIFSQDSSIKVDHLIDAYKKKIEEETNEMKIIALEEDLSYISNQTENDTTHKSYYFRIEVAKNLDYKKVHTQLIDAFLNNGIDVVAVNREEIKELVGVYFTGKHYDEYPDSELVYDPAFKQKLEKKKKLSYYDMQEKGIWTLKEYLSPLSSRIYTDHIQWGNRFLKTYTIKNYILSSEKNHLLEQVVNMKGVTTHIYYDYIDSKSFGDSWNAQIKVDNATGTEATDLITNQVNASSVSEIYERITTEGQAMMYVSVYYQLSADSKEDLDKLSAKFEAVVRRNNMEVESLKNNAMVNQGFKSVSPIGTNLLSNLIKQNMPSESTANLMPFNHYGLIDPKGLFIGHETTKNDLVDRSMVALDTFRKNTTDRANHNILVSGDSGQGKTVVIMKLIENHITNGDHVDVIDIEGTYVNFVTRLGGVAFDLSGNDSTYAINILEPRLMPEDPDAIHSKTQTINDHIPVVRSFFELYKPEWSGEVLDTLSIYLMETYKRKGIDSNTDLMRLKSEDYPILSDLFDVLDEAHELYDEPTVIVDGFASLTSTSVKRYETKGMLKTLLLGLTSSTKGNEDSKLFDRHTNLGDANKRTNAFVYDLSALGVSGSKRTVAQMFNVQSFAQTNLNNIKKGQFYLQAIDEFHFLLKPEYRQIITLLEGSLRTLRKWNGGLLLGTQTSAELLDSKDNDLKVFFTIPRYKFFFYQGDIDYVKFKDFMLLTDAEIARISTSRQGKCLLKYGEGKLDLSVHMPKWYSEVKKDA